jgi:hypothetical protein
MIRLLLAFIAVLAFSAGPTAASAKAAGQPCAMTDQMPMGAAAGHQGQAPDPCCDHRGKACADACAAMSIAVATFSTGTVGELTLYANVRWFSLAAPPAKAFEPPGLDPPPKTNA